jgi:hypothetical protein
MPAIVVMTITATRMYRSLSDFGSHTELCAIFLPFVIFRSHFSRCHSISTGPEGFRKSDPSAPHGNLAINAQSRLEVVVNTTHEQYMTGQSSTIGPERHLRDKSHKLGLHEDAESNA